MLVNSLFQNIVINAKSASNIGKNSLDTLYVNFFSFVHGNGSFEKIYTVFDFSMVQWHGTGIPLLRFFNFFNILRNSDNNSEDKKNWQFFHNICIELKSQSKDYSVLRIRDVYPVSRILIFTHPGSRISDPGSRISDLGSRIPKQVEKRGVKKFVVKHLFVATNFTKCKII